MARKRITQLQAVEPFVVEDEAELVAVAKANPAYRRPLDVVVEDGEDLELYEIEGRPQHVEVGQRCKSNDSLVKGREALFEEVPEE